jgi:1-phosphofructokinase
VVIAGPNLTIDRTLSIAELRPGEVLRFERAVVTPGGKGVNVARVARELGEGAVLVGFIPGRTGAAGAALLADEGLSLRSVEVGGELRSTAVVLERSGRVTVFNEPGPPLAPGDWERYEAEVADALAGEGARGSVPPGASSGQLVLACSGSLPPGAPDDAYGRLVAVAHERDALAIVDVGGGQLAGALAAGADVVTPNLAEAEGLLHGRADEMVEAGDVGVVRERAVAAARALVERGARRAVVTAAEAGAAAADGWLARWVAAPAVGEVRNPIGAGDALVGGLALALERGEEFAAAVALGMACGAASVETDVAGVVVPARVASLLGAGF